MDFSKIKKDISMFLTSEEAKVLKKDIVKLGLTASAIATIIAQAQTAQSQHTDSHSDSHADSHDDSVGHNDVHFDSHTDDTPHYDSHADSHTATHADAHVAHNDASGGPHSSTATYDPARHRGGHNSRPTHSSF